MRNALASVPSKIAALVAAALLACAPGKDLVGRWERTGQAGAGEREWLEFAGDGSFVANVPGTVELVRGTFEREDGAYVLRPATGPIREVRATLKDGLLVWDDGATYRKVAPQAR